MLLASPIGDIFGDTRDMEFKDHAGPVYALHRIFTLNDVDWPHLETLNDELEENGDSPPAASPMTVPVC